MARTADTVVELSAEYGPHRHLAWAEAVNFTDEPYGIVPSSTPLAGSIQQIADRIAKYAVHDVWPTYR